MILSTKEFHQSMGRRVFPLPVKYICNKSTADIIPDGKRLSISPMTSESKDVCFHFCSVSFFRF